MNWYKSAKKNNGCSGWLAVRLDKESSNKIQKWGKKYLTEEILYNKKKDNGRQTEFGLELDTHITVVYGICADSLELIKAALKDQKPIKATLGKVGFFKHPDGYEPLIIKIDSEDLCTLHQKIKQSLCIETTFKEYKPHCTIGYVKSGKAMQFAGDTIFNGIKLIFDKVVFVNNKDEESYVKLSS